VRLVSIDPEDLLALVRACKEFELDARACRAAMNGFRLNPTIDQRFAQVYCEFYGNERESYTATVERKYAPVVEAIEQRADVAGALRKVADQVRR
jgi:hypothetical protein